MHEGFYMRKPGWRLVRPIGIVVVVFTIGMAAQINAKDISAGTFAPPRGYVGVHSQQGRVRTDNDRKITPVLKQQRIQINNGRKVQPCGVSCRQIAPH